NWHGDIRAAHIQVLNMSDTPAAMYYHRRYKNSALNEWQVLKLKGGESYRFAVTQSSSEETGVELAALTTFRIQLHGRYDRAHFPTMSLDEGHADSDIAPLPVFPGKQLLSESAGQLVSHATSTARGY